MSDVPPPLSAKDIAAQQEVIETAKRLTGELEQLDFGNLDAVLQWLCDIQDPSEYACVKLDSEKILAAFAAHGFHVNNDLVVDTNDRESHARYIINQCLILIQAMSIPQMLHGYVAQWRKKFGEKLAA